MNPKAKKSEKEIIEEVKRRAKYTLKQSESYGSYRSNMNFLRGLLWCLGYDTARHYNLQTILKIILIENGEKKN